MISWHDIHQSIQSLWGFLSSGSSNQQSLSAVREGIADPNISAIIRNHFNEFLFWVMVSSTIILVILLISITKKFEEWFDPILLKIKRFAPYIMQITLGLALIISAYYDALFGPSLPLTAVFGTYAGMVQIMIYAGGAMLLLGLFPRLVSFAVVLLSVPLVVEHTGHILTHATYIGEALTIFLLGGAYHSVKGARSELIDFTKEIRLHFHKYKFLILRIFLGASLITSAISARLLVIPRINEIMANSQFIALFPDPNFFIMGVIILEVLFGLFFIIGFEIRFASLAYLGFLAFSVIFFQEPMWPHIILVGTPLAMFTHGYDEYTIGGRFFSRGNLEPIL